MRPFPLKLTTISLEDRLNTESDTFDTDGLDLRIDPKQSVFFHQELTRIEKERTWIYSLSELYLESRKSRFLERLLTKRHWDFPLLQQHYDDLLASALEPSPEALSAAADAWEWFKYSYFGKYRLPVPDWPVYVEIQEGLGIYGRTWAHRYGRRVKRVAQRHMLRIFQYVCRHFGGWKWAAEKQRYLKGVLTSEYRA